MPKISIQRHFDQESALHLHFCCDHDLDSSDLHWLKFEVKPQKKSCLGTACFIHPVNPYLKINNYSCEPPTPSSYLCMQECSSHKLVKKSLNYEGWLHWVLVTHHKFDPLIIEEVFHIKAIPAWPRGLWVLFIYSFFSKELQSFRCGSSNFAILSSTQNFYESGTLNIILFAKKKYQYLNLILYIILFPLVLDDI